MKIFITLLLLLFISGCSLKTTDRYKYRVNASNSFESYQRYYLQGKTTLASVSLKRAINSAKLGSDIDSLATIYLGECAITNALFINDNCKEYKKVSAIIKNSKLENFYRLLRGKVETVDTKKLPKSYISFADFLKKGKYKKAFNAIKDMPSPISKLIAASIIKENLSTEEIKYIIKVSSSMGYRNATIKWYKFLLSKSSPKEKVRILKKIRLLR